MKLSSLIVSYFAIGCALVAGQNWCPSQCIRKNILTAPRNEVDRYLAAVKALFDSPSGRNINYFSRVHDQAHDYAHSQPRFLLWHRSLLLKFQDELKKIDPSVCLMYWDWSTDSQAPENSMVFRSDMLGGNGRSGDHALADGKFAYQNLQYPNTHYLKRDFNRGSRISAFRSPQNIKMAIDRSYNFQQIWDSLEGPIHADPHMNTGGDQGDFSTMYSTNDPIFWLHHTFIDRLYWHWQSSNPNIARDYSARGANINEQMWPWNDTPDSMMSTTAYPNCYTYDSLYSANFPNSRARTRMFKPPPSTRSLVGKLSKSVVDTMCKGWKFLDPDQSYVQNIAQKILTKEIDSKPLSCDDRSTPYKLRSPAPVPESFLRMNNLNITKFREQEAIMNAQNEALNLIEDFNPDTNVLDPALDATKQILSGVGNFLGNVFDAIF